MMENRKTKQVFEYIEEQWQLSLREKDILEQILDLFKNEELSTLKKLEYVLDEDYRKILDFIPQRSVFDFALDNFDLVSTDDEQSLLNALDGLDYNFMDDLSEEDLLERASDLGYNLMEGSSNVVLDSQKEELLEAFESMDFRQREELISKIR